MVLKVTGKEKEEKPDENVPVDSLGIAIRESNFDLKQKKSIFLSSREFFEENPALALSILLVVVSVIYALAFFSKLGTFHYIAFIISSLFMVWVGLADDARLGYKLLSEGLIFIALIVYLSL